MTKPDPLKCGEMASTAVDVSGDALDWLELRRRTDEGELQRAWSRVDELTL